MDGNPSSRFRRGDNGAFQCLVDDYGINDDAAITLINTAKKEGFVEFGKGASPAVP
jgi:hypothetical protein